MPRSPKFGLHFESAIHEHFPIGQIAREGLYFVLLPATTYITDKFYRSMRCIRFYL